MAAVALLEEPKRRRLYEYVAERGEAVGRDEAASAVGISRELAAFHLDRLAEAGLLNVEYRRLGTRRGPGAGRPSKLYRRAETEVAVSLPARRYKRAADMFAEALDATRGKAAREAVASVAHAHGFESGSEARPQAGAGLGVTEARQALLSLLRESGYEPETASDDERIYLRNCPYHSLAQSHTQVTCGMNLAWAEGVAEALREAKLKPSYSASPGRCCVVFEADKHSS